MSNPLTNVDIEDVLSSIRRLVSEGDRTVAPRPAEAVREVASATPGRFVLTPALRVVAPAADAGDTETVSADVAPADPAPLILTNNRNLSNLEATIAELEAAVTWQNDEFEPDGSEVAATQQWTDAPSDLRRRVVDDAEIADAENTDSANAENADAEVAEIENADAPVAMPNLMFHHKTYDETDDDHHDDLMDGDDDDAADDLTAYLDDDSTIDESALRDMVAQIVRAELQGELGERITRNVRKLVRREIYRVINSQEFE